MVEKISYFEYLQKRYTFKELVENLNEKIIICPKDVKQKVSLKKLEALSLEDEFTIKLFKSYFSDQYIVLEGAKYIVALYRIYFSDKDFNYFFKEVLNSSQKIKTSNKNTLFEDNIKEIFENFDKEIQVSIIYSNKEQETPRNFYRRIKDIFGISVKKFLTEDIKEV